MNETFQIGNLVIMQKATHYFEYDGLLAVVTKPLQTRWCMDLNTMERLADSVYGIRILTLGGFDVFARPWQIRRLSNYEEKDNRLKNAVFRRDLGRKARKDSLVCL